MENNKIDKKDYYGELHEAARNYNTKLWTIPGLFIVVLGFLVNYEIKKIISLEQFTSLENFIVLVGSGLIIFLLLTQFAKDSFFQISIQKEINKLEKEMDTIPLYSATDTEITKRLQQLKEQFDIDNNNVSFSRFREQLIRENVSKLFLRIAYLILSLIILSSLFIVCVIIL